MNPRILVVDDTVSNLQSLSATLRKCGYEVSVAASGEQALEAVGRVLPDLILLDVMMPGMDGFETCCRLKKQDSSRAIPIIFLTALNEPADIVKAFELGAVDYVSKPFNAPELLARVNTHLTMDRLHRENERLLLSILPASIAQRLKSGEAGIANHFAEASVLFADLVNFTTLSHGLSPAALVFLLNDLFTGFDELARRHGAEKIKTIGDCYMAACGLPEIRADHATALADLALEMLASLESFNERHRTSLEIRIGLDTGPLVAGVIGSSKFIYDLWGDTVNMASRMESAGVPGRVQVTAAMQRALASDYDMEERGEIDIKGKGRLRTWLLVGRKPGAANGQRGPAATELRKGPSHV